MGWLGLRGTSRQPPALAGRDPLRNIVRTTSLHCASPTTLSTSDARLEHFTIIMFELAQTNLTASKVVAPAVSSAYIPIFSRPSGAKLPGLITECDPNLPGHMSDRQKRLVRELRCKAFDFRHLFSSLGAGREVHTAAFEVPADSSPRQGVPRRAASRPAVRPGTARESAKPDTGHPNPSTQAEESPHGPPRACRPPVNQMLPTPRSMAGHRSKVR